MQQATVTSSPPKVLTMKSGGWVLVAAAVLSVGLFVWALLPVVLGVTQPPGDGKTLESYGFDLSNLVVPRELIVPALRHRDMSPVMDAPSSSRPEAPTPQLQRDNPDADRWEAMQQRNDPRRGKYLVKSDRVIGVVVNGEARAYPISTLNVHEIVNDTLGGEPIAVTYSWHGDSPRVYSRRVGDRIMRFGVSGFLYNSNLVMYDRPDQPPVLSIDPAPQSSLYSQMLGEAIGGPTIGTDAARLTALPYQLTTWQRWRDTHPETTVLDRDSALLKRYKGSDPSTYFNDAKIAWPVAHRPTSALPPLFERVVIVETGGERLVYPHNLLAGKVNAQGIWATRQAGLEIEFLLDREAGTVEVNMAEAGLSSAAVDHALWFAWHAMHPSDPLAVP